MLCWVSGLPRGATRTLAARRPLAGGRRQDGEIGQLRVDQVPRGLSAQLASDPRREVGAHPSRVGATSAHPRTAYVVVLGIWGVVLGCIRDTQRAQHRGRYQDMTGSAEVQPVGGPHRVLVEARQVP